MKHFTVTPQHALKGNLFEGKFPLASRMHEELQEDLVDVGQALFKKASHFLTQERWNWMLSVSPLAINTLSGGWMVVAAKHKQVSSICS